MVNIKDSFWSYHRNLISNEMVDYQWRTLNDLVPEAEPSHAIKNFEIAAGKTEGKYFGAVFQDSDLYKWIEMAANTLSYNNNEELKSRLNYVIELIELSQEDDGYLNTYYQLEAPNKKWTNLRDHHELYCAGHLLEAAVSMKTNLDDDRLLIVAKKFTEHISDIFGYDKKRGYPGHQEIELGLLRAYEVTQDTEFIDLAEYFILERGNQPHYFDIEKEGRDPRELIWNSEPDFNFGMGYEYQQAHKPIYEQDEAVGHSVRAVYYYASIAKLLQYRPDSKLQSVIENLWRNIVDKKMYITGGIGSNENGESFGENYELPNDTMYCETCASIGLVFFANELSKLTDNAEYAEIIEKVIFNTALSGMNIEGNRFFYVNPLEINHDYIDNLKYEHVKTERQKWLSVACCPPNLGRLISSLDRYIYVFKEKDNKLFINQFISNEADINPMVKVKINGAMPYGKKLEFEINNTGKNLKVYIRKASWMNNLRVKVNGEESDYTSENSYIEFDSIDNKMLITFEYDIEVKEYYSNPNVTNNLGKVALVRGPLVYCLEEEDNTKGLLKYIIPNNAEYTLEKGGIRKSDNTNYEFYGLNFDCYKYRETNSLYVTENKFEKVKAKAIPYYLWANRNNGNMRIWIPKEVIIEKGEENE